MLICIIINSLSQCAIMGKKVNGFCNINNAIFVVGFTSLIFVISIAFGISVLWWALFTSKN